IEMKVRSNVSVLPQEVSTYYTENKNQMYAPLTYVFYIATAESQKVVEDIAAKIKTEGLNQALNEHPQDLTRIESAKDELKPEIAAVVSKLKKSEVEMIKIDDSYYLIYLDELIEPKLFSLPQAQDKIYAYLWDKKFKEKFSEWIKTLKEKSVIKVYEQE
ncbi:MAG: peptidyl-prolyl cis-trans isomerase, partial [Candidatus Omnitrophica bacterium]|nr:peptidyl-prolyl cis-trans isomerase [Candidatus Omnitrophota bacterium]